MSFFDWLLHGKRQPKPEPAWKSLPPIWEKDMLFRCPVCLKYFHTSVRPQSWWIMSQIADIGTASRREWIVRKVEDRTPMELGACTHCGVLALFPYKRIGEKYETA